MNSNHSAGEGRLGGRWEGVYIAGGRERELWQRVLCNAK